MSVDVECMSRRYQLSSERARTHRRATLPPPALLAHRIEASGKRCVTELDKDEVTYHCTHAPPSCTGTDEYLAVFQVNGVSGRRERDIDMNRCTGTSA